MGFFDRFSPKKQEKERIEIKEEEIEGILEERVGSIWKDETFQPKEIESMIGKILNSIEELRKKEVRKENVHKTLIELSLSARKSIVVITKREVESLDFSSLKEFYTNTGKALDIISNNNSKYEERVKILFSQPYLKLWDQLKSLYGYYNNIKESTNKKIENEEKFSKWLDQIRKNRSAIGFFEELRSQRKELQIYLEKTEQRLELLKKEIQELQSSNEFKDHKTSKDKLSEIKNNIRSLESQFSGMILNVKKALLYYKHRLADSQTKKIIDRMDQTDFMCSKNSLKNTIFVFSELKKNLKIGNINLDKKRKEKTKVFLSKYDEKHLESLFLKHEKLIELSKGQEKNIDSSLIKRKGDELKRKKEDKSTKVFGIKGEIKNLSEKIKTQNEILEKDSQNISKIKQELEKMN